MVDLQYLVKELKDAQAQGLDTFVVDRSGRLVAAASARYATGQDMRSNELVNSFAEQKGNAQISVTKEFDLPDNKNKISMLGTYDPVPGLPWAVPHRDCYVVDRHILFRYVEQDDLILESHQLLPPKVILLARPSAA